MSDLRQRTVRNVADPLPSPNSPATGPSDISPAVPSSVIIKLLVFVAMLVFVPLGTYFGTLNTVFNGKSTWAGASAAFMANVVVIGYVVAAIYEDYSEGEQEKKGSGGGEKELKKTL